MKRRSISYTLSLFVVIIILVMGLLITSLLFIRIGQAFYKNQQDYVQNQVYILTESVGNYLRNLEYILKDHAAFPVMIQGVMQPDVNHGSVQDFMENLTFLGEKYQEVLLDFQGEVVYASHHEALFDYKKKSWVSEIVDGNVASYRGISKDANGNYYWQLVLPVLYNGLVEGILVAEVPLESLGKQLKKKYVGNISLEILWKDTIIKRVGNNFKGVEVVVRESFSGAALKFYIDTSASKQARNQLLIENFLLLIALAFLAMFVATRLGRRWFVEPIQQLQSFTRDVADNRQYQLSSKKQGMKELKNLADDFNLMADCIRSREDALRESNKKLQSSQAQLVQAEKMASLGTLAAGVAHEINNPVSFIKSNVGTLQNYLNTLIPLLRDYQCCDGLPEDKRDAFLNEMKQRCENEDVEFLLEDIAPILNDTVDGADRVKDIVAGLKTFVHADDAEEKIFNLNDCVENTLKMVWNELKYKCEVKQNLGDIPVVCGNPGQINQVITNLLVNAAQAILERGDIIIETKVEAQKVILSVSDTGAGISPENLEKLFTPFFTTKEVGQGTGLGLSISYGIIEQHGGKMHVDSEVGKGTTFTITLPAYKEN